MKSITYFFVLVNNKYVHSSQQNKHMDNSKKQIRLFKIIIAVLMVVVIAQGSFWLNVFSNPTASEYNPVQKVKVINQQRKVVAPVVGSFIELISNLSSGK